jgi:hypothetical protein
MTPQQLRRHMADKTLPAFCRLIDPEAPLDRGISYAVKILRENGVETFESCQGGPGHSFAEPTVRFHGEQGEGYRAVAVALQAALPVAALRRVWRVLDGELEGPAWEMTFSRGPLTQVQRRAERSGLLDVTGESGPSGGGLVHTEGH